jgi:hypothetical protein
MTLLNKQIIRLTKQGEKNFGATVLGMYRAFQTHTYHLDGKKVEKDSTHLSKVKDLFRHSKSAGWYIIRLT